MTSKKLVRMLDIISESLNEKDIAYALIGALALGVYGCPRFTADIDLLIEDTSSELIYPLMKKLGYTCFQKGNSFAQFDSELGVFGRIDFIFVSTDEGKNIIKRSVAYKDDILGIHPVIQPQDYMGLKLMDMANNPVRSSRDEGDILDLLQLIKKGMLPLEFELPDRDKLYHYADRFGQRDRLDEIYRKIDENSNRTKSFEL